MKPKQLVPLAIVLAVLVALVLLRRSQEDTPTLTEQVQLQPLVPDGLAQHEISRIEFFAGASDADAVVLQKEDDGSWTLPTLYGAPIMQNKLDDLLKDLVGLKGEYRATSSGDGLGDYKLLDDQCFHVRAYGEGSDTPLFHVLAGKAPSFGDAFARAADGDDVYIITVNLRRHAGIYTVALTDPPKPAIWLDKEIFDLDQDRVRRVALTYPDKEVAFEYRKFEVADETPPGEGEEEGAAPEMVEESRWVVASGGVNDTLNETSLSNMTRRMSPLNATEVVDPETPDAWGLNPPQYVARIQLEGQDEEMVVEAGRPAEDRYAYIRLPGDERNLVYKISGYDFEQIFAVGGKLFELPGILVDEADVARIEYTTDTGNVVLARVDEAWTLVEPESDLEALQTEIDGIARTALSWKAADYADGTEGTELDSPSQSVTISGGDVEHRIVLGARTPSGQGFYARLDDGTQSLVMNELDQDNIFVAPGDLFDKSLFKVPAGDISTIELTQGDENLRLESTDTGWATSANGEAFAPNEAAVNDVRSVLSLLKADDLDFTHTPGEVMGAVRFTTATGDEHSITVETEQEGLHAVTMPGKTTAYLVPRLTVFRLFPGLDILKQAEPEAAEEAASEDAPEE